jgi:hypothetical protein
MTVEIQPRRHTTTHVGHKNANRPHAHGSACMLVTATQDVVLGYVLSGSDQQAIGFFVSYVTANS